MGHTCATHSEDGRERLVGRMEVVRVRVVASHQQPARESCLDDMEPGAGDRLRRLAHDDMNIALQATAQRDTAFEFLAKEAASIRQAVPQSCMSARDGAMAMPSTSDVPSIPSSPTSPTCSLSCPCNVAISEMDPPVGK